MALIIKHAFTSEKPDGANTTLVQPSDWNANHEFANLPDDETLFLDGTGNFSEPPGGFTDIEFPEDIEGTGTISDDGTGQVTGVGTTFGIDIQMGDRIYANGQDYGAIVTYINSETEMNVSVPLGGYPFPGGFAQEEDYNPVEDVTFTFRRPIVTFGDQFWGNLNFDYSPTEGAGQWNLGSQFGANFTIGGDGNWARDSFASVIIGGTYNRINNGGESVIIGGYANTISGDECVAMGYGIRITGSQIIGIGLGQEVNDLTQNNTFIIMDGKVGIGTTTPDSRLSVEDHSANSVAIFGEGYCNSDEGTAIGIKGVASVGSSEIEAETLVSLWAGSPELDGDATAGEAIGLYVENVTVGEANWAILTGQGLVEFGDRMEVQSADSDGDTIVLTVKSNGSQQNADLTRWLAPNESMVASVQANGCMRSKTKRSFVEAHTSAAAITIDCTDADMHLVTLVESTTLTVTNPADGQRITVILAEGDGNGPYTITWSGNVTGGLTVTSEGNGPFVQELICYDGSQLLALA